jgi:hypothetical protein
MIIHFIANFPHDLFELKLKLNLDMLFEKKMDDPLRGIKFVDSDDKSFKTIKTVTGHSAFLLCMLNEKQKDWILEPIFKKILKNGYFDPEDYSPMHPLTLAIQHDCMKSIKYLTSDDLEENVESNFVPF